MAGNLTKAGVTRVGIEATGGYERGGGGLTERIRVISVPASVLRTTGAG